MMEFLEEDWEVESDAHATAVAGDAGRYAAMQSNGEQIEGLEVYTFTNAGLSLSATALAANYLPDKSLN